MRISIDDGCASDVRIADLCKKYEVEAIFYWPVEWHSLAYENGYRPLDYNEAMEIAQQFEIGSHTITHRHLTKIPTVEAIKEIVGSHFMLKRMFKQPITKFAPPRGYTNEELTDMTLQIYQTQRLTKGANLVHIHPDSGANGNMPWKQRYYDIRDTQDVELWGHSWELDKFDLWDELEEFLREQY